MNACNCFYRPLSFESLAPRIVMAAGVFYVDPVHGDDAASGLSVELAWKSPANFVSYYTEADRPAGHQQLGPGDIVYVLPGEINFQYLYDGQNESLFLRDVHGTAEAPIRLQAMSGAKLRSFAADGSEMNAIHLLGSSHIDVVGFDITSYGSAVRLADTEFIGVYDNYIHDVDGWANDNLSGIYLTDAHSTTIQGNLLRDIYDRNQPESQNNRPIVIFGSMNVRLLYNEVWNSRPETGFGIEYKHLGSLSPAQAAGMTFEVAGNTLINVGGNGVGTAAPNSWIHFNLLIDAGGVRVDDIGGTHQLAGELIEYNTIINSQTDRLGSGSLAYDPTETVDSPRGAYPLGTVEFAHNLIVDGRDYNHSERRTLSVYRYGSDDEYRNSIGMGKLLVDQNFYDTREAALFDMFGADYQPLGGDFDFSQWQALGYDRNGTIGNVNLDAYYRPGDNTASHAGIYAGKVPRLMLIPLNRNLTESGAGSEQQFRLTRTGEALATPLVVSLSTVATDQITLPAQVTIPAGAASIEFSVRGVANSIAEVPRAVSIHAMADGLQTSTWLMLEDGTTTPAPTPTGVFQVPNAATRRVRMDAVVTERFAEYNNELGFAYVDDAQGRAKGLLPTDVGWLTALLNQATPLTVFNSGAKAGDTSSTELDSGRYVVWYLVQDASLEAWRALNPENSLSIRPLIFTSIAEGNPDRYEHLHSTVTAKQWQLAWEDQEFGGDQSFQDFNITASFLDVAASALVEYSVRPVNSQGELLTSVCVGEDFFVDVNVKDLRSVPSGIFSAALDVEFSSATAQFIGPLQYGERFVNRQSGNSTSAGVIDEIGAVTDGSSGSSSQDLLVRIPMRATAAGTFSVTSNPADILPSHEVTLVGLDNPVQPDLIRYGSADLEIRPANKWHNKNIGEDVNGDGHVSPIDALRIINFINLHGSQSELTAASVDAFFDGSMLDTNNDGSITPIDALLVINRLNLESTLS